MGGSKKSGKKKGGGGDMHASATRRVAKRAPLRHLARARTWLFPEVHEAHGGDGAWQRRRVVVPAEAPSEIAKLQNAGILDLLVDFRSFGASRTSTCRGGRADAARARQVLRASSRRAARATTDLVRFGMFLQNVRQRLADEHAKRGTQKQLVAKALADPDAPAEVGGSGTSRDAWVTRLYDASTNL